MLRAGDIVDRIVRAKVVGASVEGAERAMGWCRGSQRVRSWRDRR